MTMGLSLHDPEESDNNTDANNVWATTDDHSVIMTDGGRDVNDIGNGTTKSKLSELPFVENVLGDLENNDEMTSSMKVDVEGGKIRVEYSTGNKQLVGVAEGMDNGDLDLDIIAYQRPKTSERASGEADIEVGDIVKTVRWTHSGKNSSDTYGIYDGDKIVEISGSEARELQFMRSNGVPSNGVVTNNKEQFGIDTSRSGDGWVQRIDDYDESEYKYNWNSEFVNEPITSYQVGEVVRTSRGEFYLVTDNGFEEVSEDEARKAAQSGAQVQ